MSSFLQSISRTQWHLLAYLCSSCRLSDAMRYRRVIERGVPPPMSQNVGAAQVNCKGNVSGKETGISVSETQMHQYFMRRPDIYSPTATVHRHDNSCPIRAMMITLFLPRRSAIIPYGTTIRSTVTGLRSYLFGRSDVQTDSHSIDDMPVSQFSNPRSCCTTGSSK